jgi:hypothetical protein
MSSKATRNPPHAPLCTTLRILIIFINKWHLNWSDSISYAIRQKLSPQGIFQTTSALSN